MSSLPMQPKENGELANGEAVPRNYSKFSGELLQNGLLKGKYPFVTTSSNRLEEQAREHLGSKPFNFISGGAGEGATMEANRLAFRQWKIIPRMLTPSTHHDLRTEIFGIKLNSPIVMSPVGVQEVIHRDKELASAAAAAEVGVPFTQSTAATASIEAVAAANGSDGIRFYQLYWPVLPELTLSLLARAKASGYRALVVTLDTWHVGYRPCDLDQAYVPFVQGSGCQVVVSDPVFRRIFEERHPGKRCEDDMHAVGRLWSEFVHPGVARTWDDLKFLRDNWDGPLVLKGIQHVDDAREALNYGVNGIWISNHGGRQLDGAIGSLDCLAEISEAVGDRTTIFFDSGVRTGADVIKALCLGANAVCIGRPWVYGLAIDGKLGVKAVLESILADLDVSIGCAGIASLKDCKRNMVRKILYPGDRFSNN